MNPFTRVSHVVGTVALSGAVALIGSASAQAYSWATSNAPLSVNYQGSLAGQGYGSFTAQGWGQATLKSSLRDLKKDNTRAFVDADLTGAGVYAGTQSGRRADGGSSFATMGTTTAYAGASIAGTTGQVKICQDVPRHVDQCSSTRSGRL